MNNTNKINNTNKNNFNNIQVTLNHNNENFINIDDTLRENYGIVICLICPKNIKISTDNHNLIGLYITDSYGKEIPDDSKIFVEKCTIFSLSNPLSYLFYKDIKMRDYIPKCKRIPEFTIKESDIVKFHVRYFKHIITKENVKFKIECDICYKNMDKSMITSVSDGFLRKI